MRKLRAYRRRNVQKTLYIAEPCEPRYLLAAIASDQTLTGAIAAPGQVDSYTFTAAPGQSIFVAAAEIVAGSPLTVAIEVRAPNNTVINNASSATGTALLITTLTQTGTYTINVSGVSNTLGSYAVTLAQPGVAPVAGTDAGPITSAAYRTAAITPGDLDVHTVSGTAGGSLLTAIGDLDPASGFDPQIHIFSPSGALLDNASNANGTIVLTQNLPTTGTYYVVASDSLSDETGTYGISIAAFGGPQASDADSGPIASASRRLGTIDPGDFDVHTISGTLGGSLLAAIGDLNPASGFDPQVMVFSPAGALLANASSGIGTNVLTSNLPATGTYYVATFDALGDETGAYGVSVATFGGAQTPGDTDSGPVTSGEYRTGAIDPGDFDVYTITAPNGGSLLTTIGDLDAASGYDPQLLTFSPTGALLDNASGGNGTAILRQGLSAAGTYYVVALDALSDETGAYGLSVGAFGGGAQIADADSGAIASGERKTGAIDPGDFDVYTISANSGGSLLTALGGAQTVSPGDEGGALTSGERRLGRIAPGDIDTYTFDLANGNGAYWTVGETAENSFTPHLIILGPAGQVISDSANARGRDAALANSGAATTGTYTAIVLDSPGGQPGEYALTGVAVPAAQPTDDDSGPLTTGQRRAGALPPGDADVYTVAASAGQSLAFTLAETAAPNATFDPSLIVYGPGGTIAASNVNPTTATVTIPSAVAGTYTVVVSDSGGDGSGAYSLALNTTVGADTFAPQLLDLAYRFNDPLPRIRFAFSEDVSASFDPANFVLKNLTTNHTIDPADLAITFTTVTHEILFNFNPLPGGVLPDGNYRLTLPASKLTDAAANQLAQSISYDFFVFSADANRDRLVDFNDLVILAQNYNVIGGRTFIQGDYNYDGNVDFNDLVLLAQRYNTSLPAPAPPAAPATGLTPLSLSAPAVADVAVKSDSSAKSLFSTVPVTRPVARKPKPPTRGTHH